MGRRAVRLALGLYLAASIGIALWLLPSGRELPPAFAAERALPTWSASLPFDAARNAALRQARVWQPSDAAAFDVAANPPDPSGLLSAEVVRCRYLSRPARGTTTKFDCVLADGEVVKVKYGRTGEIHAEVAASRLLTALGFGADRMYVVARLRCFGCVRDPFYTAWAFDYVHARDLLARSVPADAFTDFEWVAVERRHDGIAIENDRVEGWGFDELDAVDPSRGASRAERDALRLAAVLLAHWDNKPANQRLVCLDDSAPCRKPFAFIHDLGATFGPNKIDLDGWRRAPVWADPRSCTVSMKTLPYHGATFPDARISESGRALLAGELARLTDARLEALFTAARFPQFFRGAAPEADVSAWVAAFREKVRQIAAAGPCE